MEGRTAKPNTARLYLSELTRAAGTTLDRGVALRSLAIGRVNRHASLARVLAGLRFGTCHLVARLDGSGRPLLVGAFGGNECSWYVEVPELALPLDVEVIRAPWHGRLSAIADGRPLVIEGASADDGETVFDTGGPTGWTVGRAGAATVGDPDARVCWIAAFSGPIPEHTFTLDGHRISTRRSSSWTTVTLDADPPLAVDQASAVVADVTWLLRLAEPRRSTKVALWDAGEHEGVVTFDSIDRAMRHELIPPRHVGAFLDAAAAHWSAASPDDRRVLAAIIDMLLVACESNIETSIAISSSALELAAYEWLPSTKGQHDVSKEARGEILDALSLAATQHASGSEFAARAKEIGDWLFNRTTKERFRQLLDHLGVPADDDGVTQFVNVRNKVVHGGFQKLSLPVRTRAFLFGRWMLSTCILRRVGYAGAIVDWRGLRVD